MALTRNFPNKTGGTQTNAYIIADLTLDNKTKTGRLELAVWSTPEARASLLQKINNVSIIIENHAEVLDDTGHVEILSWSDFGWRSGLDVYTKIKTLKVRSLGQSIDMSTSIDS